MIFGSVAGELLEKLAHTDLLLRVHGDQREAHRAGEHGERGRDPYLMRQWPALDVLLHSPEGGGFAELAERLYAPLLHAVRKPRTSKGKGKSGKGGQA